MDLKKFDSRFAVLPIEKIVQENGTTKTFVFRYPLGALPGQFIMMWIPGVDEKPMSVAFDDGREFWVTVCSVGTTSNALHNLKIGDKVGIRGPFGTHYTFEKGERLALVAGGYGAAPMYFVAHLAMDMNCTVDFLIGARNKDLLSYKEKVLALGANLFISTDDGSEGVKGYVTQMLEKLLSDEKIDRVFTCGPELMMVAVGKIAEKANVPAWLSVEKYMKCGIGVCGQCALDDSGDLVCRKGPVMSWDDLKDLPEIGNYHRDAQGKKHYFK